MHWVYRGGQSAKRHQVKTLADHAHYDERDRDGCRDDQSRDQRASPVAQEQDQNRRGQHESDENRVADAVDRIADQDGLIVKRLDLHAFRDGLPHFGQFFCRQIRHRHGVAFRLTENAQQHGRLTVRGHRSYPHSRRAGHGSSPAVAPRGRMDGPGLDFALQSKLALQCKVNRAGHRGSPMSWPSGSPVGWPSETGRAGSGHERRRGRGRGNTHGRPGSSGHHAGRGRTGPAGVPAQSPGQLPHLGTCCSSATGRCGWTSGGRSHFTGRIPGRSRR